jgi:hypothetical protein
MMMSNFPFCVDYLNREREALVVLHKCCRRKIIGAVFDVGRVS